MIDYRDRIKHLVSIHCKSSPYPVMTGAPLGCFARAMTIKEEAKQLRLEVSQLRPVQDRAELLRRMFATDVLLCPATAVAAWSLSSWTPPWRRGARADLAPDPGQRALVAEEHRERRHWLVDVAPGVRQALDSGGPGLLACVRVIGRRRKQPKWPG